MINTVFPILTQEIYDNGNLNGYYRVKGLIRVLEAKDKNSPYDYWLDGTIVCFSNSLLHNEEGPAILTLPSQDSPDSEYCVYYYLNGKLVNKSGPTVVSYEKPLIWDQQKFQAHLNNKIISYSYLNDDFKKSNLDGPANYFRRGIKEFFEYYIDGFFVREDLFSSHSKVIEYRNKQILKKKMTQVFGNENE